MTPLHPAVVHLPIALVFIMPLIFIFLLWAERKGIVTYKAWYLAIALQVIIVGTSFASVSLGEREEERVEDVVGEVAIEEHEEWGKIVPWVSLGVLLSLSASVALKNKTAIKTGALVLSLGAIVPVIMAGRTGGELVYKHNAASAYLQSGIGLENKSQPASSVHENKKDKDGDED